MTLAAVGGNTDGDVQKKVSRNRKAQSSKLDRKVTFPIEPNDFVQPYDPSAYGVPSTQCAPIASNSEPVEIEVVKENHLGHSLTRHTSVEVVNMKQGQINVHVYELMRKQNDFFCYWTNLY